MLITLKGIASVTVCSDTRQEHDSVRERLIGIESCDSFAENLPQNLADLGITGGTIKLSYENGNDRFLVQTEFRSPKTLDQQQLAQLSRFTAGQWSDGLGEGCFGEIENELGVRIELCPLSERDKVDVRQVDDGETSTNPKCALYRAARDGNLDDVLRYLDAGYDIEEAYEGSTPLNTAVLGGHRDVAFHLIDRGANVHASDEYGSDILMSIAISNQIADSDAADIAREVIARGVDPNGDRDGYTPLFMACHRKKPELESVLREQGATE